MVDTTIVAVIIVAAVVLLAIAMFIMICKHTKNQLGLERRVSKRELRRKSRIFSVVMSHHHIPRIRTPGNVDNDVSEPAAHSAESAESKSATDNPDTGSTSNTSCYRGGEENQSNTLSVSVPASCNHDNSTQMTSVEVDHDSLPPLQTDPADEYMYDYKPARLPPLNPVPVQVQYSYPDEVRGSDVTS